MVQNESTFFKMLTLVQCCFNVTKKIVPEFLTSFNTFSLGGYATIVFWRLTWIASFSMFYHLKYFCGIFDQRKTQRFFTHCYIFYINLKPIVSKIFYYYQTGQNNLLIFLIVNRDITLMLGYQTFSAINLL